MEWIPVVLLPEVKRIDIYSPMSSGPVLVARRDGSICVARYESWDVEPYDEDEPYFKWVTDCSEGWIITDEVTHWIPLPKPPLKG